MRKELCILLVVGIVLSGLGVGLNTWQKGVKTRDNISEGNETRGENAYLQVANGITQYGDFLYVIGYMDVDVNIRDVLLQKYDMDGNLIWNKTWNNGDWENRGIDLIGYDGYIYLIVNYFEHGPNHDIDIILLKYDTDGNEIWNITWGENEFNDFAYDIFLYNGYLYIAGSTSYTSLLLKFDTDGNEIWNRTWEGSASGITAYNENIYLVGSIIRFTTDPPHHYEGDVFLLKYDENGNLLWNKTWEGNDYCYGSGIVEYDGNIYIAGRTEELDAVFPDTNILLLKYDSDGNLLWNTTWEGGNSQGTITITEYNGNLYVTGTTREGDIVLLKYNDGSNLIWNKTWDGGDIDRSEGIIEYNEGLYVTGYTNNNETGGLDVLLLKYDEDGNLIWSLTGNELEIEDIISPNDWNIYILISLVILSFVVLCILQRRKRKGKSENLSTLQEELK